jgi:hypothetical protein
MKENVHLDEDEIVWATVDEAELSTSAQDHLTKCSMCREKRERLHRELAQLGQMAVHFAPSPRRRIVVAREDADSRRPWIRNWGTVIAASVAAVSGIVVVLWLSLPNSMPERGRVTATPEMWEDQQLMGDIRSLETDVLSPVHLTITGGFHPVLDEEFMAFVVPPLEDNT